VQLRSQVDEAVSQANQLILKINRFLPSSKAGEVKLP
jgi:phospholipid/cholesterol/gamma-HCH transport system substrate-binding protein